MIPNGLKATLMKSDPKNVRVISYSAVHTHIFIAFFLSIFSSLCVLTPRKYINQNSFSAENSVGPHKNTTKIVVLNIYFEVLNWAKSCVQVNCLYVDQGPRWRVGHGPSTF